MTWDNFKMTMNASCPSMEKIPLKRPRLGPPDLYPQDPKQKEDELTVTNVKQGFSFTPQLSDAEFGSACKYTINAAKIGHYFRGILNKKQDLNTLPDTGKKRQQINTKDNWAVTARSKNAIEAWFKDLAGQKPLTALAKKVPIYLKREEIFITLSEYGVPMMRAAWFIKMTSAHSAAISEAKIKKRQLPDPSQEWTQTLTKFLKEQLTKIQEHFLNSSNGTTSPGEVAIDLIIRNWKYCCTLGRYMYDAGLLDKQEWLSWILDLFDKCRSLDDGYLKTLLPLVLQFVDEFNNCELLARKLAYACAKKLNLLLSEGNSSRSQSPLIGVSANGTPVNHTGNGTTSIASSFSEYMNCPFHRSIILILSTILQCIVLDCPSALIWNSFGEGRVQFALIGSPLDLLPCAPSDLPMPQRPDNAQIRIELRAAEQIIRERSHAVEVRWSSDRLQQCTDSTKILKVLNALDALDRHSFDKVEPNNSIDTLYSKIFPNYVDKENLEQVVNNDEPLVQTLCEWATCTQRSGEHRAMVVAKILEKRQNELTSTESDLSDDKDSVSSLNMISTGLPVFQNQLLHFLDNDAPVIDENNSQNRAVFANLVHLFYELIRHDVFSHHDYMCTLISRGDIVNSTNQIVKPTTFSSPEVVKDTLDSRMEIDDSKIDADLGKLLQHIQQRNTLDNPDSPKDEGPSVLSTVPPLGPTVNDKIVKHNCGSRHVLFTTHFPLPQDDWSTHECNQRYVLLYGFGKARDNVKRLTKEISKLFGKKFSIDTADGKVKRQSRGEFNFEAIVQKFHNLSYYDQHVVTSSCITTVIELLSSFGSGSSNHIPVIEHISFLCDLLQMAFNIYGLLEFCVMILKELQDVESQLESKGSNLVSTYTSYLSLYTVGVLRKYHCCLLVSQEQVSAVFEYLLKYVKPSLSHPHEISSAERCILAYLFDLHKSCSFLHSKQYEIFTSASSKIKATLFAPLQPSKSDLRWNLEFMSEYFANPKKKIEISCLKPLNENPGNRYSFVCNAVIGICNESDNEKLNDIAVMCAELTAGCNALAGEWLGVLEALCCSSTRYFIDVLTQVDVTDLSIHNNLAVFTAILIARHCFSLQDFVVHVALPSLVKAWNEARGGPDAEPGARLTCHLLLRLFKTVETPQIFPYCSSNSGSHSIANPSTCHILYTCDRNLLAAAHTNIGVGPVLAVLKGILVLGDAIQKDCKSKVESTKLGSGELSISYILGTNDSLMNNDDTDIDIHMGLNMKKGSSGIESANLSDFAKHVLIQICSQDWVRDKCLQNPEILCSTDFLLDNTLKPKQAQRLLHMICHPENPCPPEDSQDQKKTLSKLLENLDQWRLCVSWLNLHLMYKQYQNAPNTERDSLLTNIAEAVIQVFQSHTDTKLSKTKNSDKLSGSSKCPIGFDKKSSIWLVAPLVSKLSSTIQSRVLWAASQVLVIETSSWTAKNRDKEKSRSPSLLSHLPFLSLVQTCLKGQDGERDPLLTSLKKQLEQFLHLGKEEKLFFEDEKSRRLLLDALQLRFSLVGMMFDTIMESSTATSDWAILLVQLVCNNVVDLNNNLELFPTIIDMLAMLIHSTLVCDNSNPGEENKKQYQTLVKKLKKEVQDKINPSLKFIKQLLPLTKHYVKVITCEPMGTLTDTKGNRIQGFDLIDKKQGLQVSEEQKLSPWDLLEGHKNPAPLSWAWFGATKLERKPLKYEEAFKLQLYHLHSMKKPESYYLEPPPLPPEDLEPPPEKVKEEDKSHEVPSSETTGRATGGKKQTKQRVSRKKRVTNGQQMMSGISPQPSIPNMPFQHTPMYQQGPGPHSWGYNQNQPYYNQQPIPMAGAGPRLERCNAQSKEAISQMLRNRHPNAQYMAQQPPFQNMNRGLRQPVMRGGIQNVPRHSVQNPMYGMQQGMGQMYSMQQPTGGINQTYSTVPNNYNNQMGQGQPMMEQSHGMMNQGFSQSNFVNQTPVMNMPGQNNVGNAYMGHSGMNPQMSGLPQRNTQYNMSNNMPGAAVNPVANQQMYPQQGVTQAINQKTIGQVPQFNQSRLHQQQQMQARMRQQMMMQQQQPTADQIAKHQQSMQGAQGPQSTAALVAHLQRSLSSGGPQQQMNSGVPQQHNPYHQTY